MGTVTNSIGTSSRDYSTIALWEAALPASLVTDGNSYVGQCFNDSEFNLSTTSVTIGGSTTDATHTITLTTGTGQSFRDAAGAASNALRYNQSNGVGITGAIAYARCFIVNDNYVTISNLQIKSTAGNGRGTVGYSSATNGVVDSCIHWENTGRAENDIGIVDFFSSTPATAQNNLIIVDSANASVGLNTDQTATFVNNTIVKPTNRSAGATPVLGIKTHYGTVTIQNNVVAGFGTDPCIGGNATKTGSGNATDATSYPSGVTGQTSLTMATEFVQPSNGSSVMDWRLNSTSVNCKDNGTNSGAPTTDIIGQAISNTTRDVGAWELQQSAAAATIWVPSSSSPDASIASRSIVTAVLIAASAGLTLPLSPPPAQAVVVPQGWSQPLSQAVPVAKPKQGHASVPFPQIAAPQGWYTPLSSPVAVAKAQLGNSFVPFNTPQIVIAPANGWYAPLSIAVPVAKFRQGISFVPFNTAQAAQATPPNGWFGPPSNAPKVAQAWPTQTTSFAVPPQTAVAAVTPGQFGWYAQLSKAAPIVRAKPGSSFVPFDTVQLSFSTATGVPLVQDAGVPRPVNVYYQSMFNPLAPMPPVQNTVTQVTWQQPLSVAVKLSKAAPQGITFVPFNTVQASNSITSFGWFSPLSKPAPVAVPSAGYAFVPFDTAQIPPVVIVIPPPPTGWIPATKNIETWSTISNVNGLWIPAIKNIEGWT